MVYKYNRLDSFWLRAYGLWQRLDGIVLKENKFYLFTSDSYLIDCVCGATRDASKEHVSLVA